MLFFFRPHGITAWEQSDDSEDEATQLKPTKVDIDLGLSAYANARK